MTSIIIVCQVYDEIERQEIEIQTIVQAVVQTIVQAVVQAVVQATT